MKPPLHVPSLLGGLALTAALLAVAPSAHANVYATNIKINGTLTGAASVAQGSSATITYVLNEPASSGVTIKILSGNTAVRTVAIAGGNPGTTQGLNTVNWDGKDDSSVGVPLGSYTVQITAATAGYAGPGWTEIVNNMSSKIYWPSGVAVDTNIKSPYYGRVMVANGVNTANNVAPHPAGIVKFNADGSEADEGQSTPAGAFRTDAYLGDSCRSIKYGSDDRIYFLDWVGDGKASACDMTMSTSQVILDTDQVNAGATGNFADMDVTDAGTTNALVWFGDGNYPPSGVWCWPMTNNGVADPTFAGINVVAQGPDIPLRSGYGMEIDQAGDIFIGEVRGNSGDVYPKLTSITNVWGASFGYATNWWNNDNNSGSGYPITGSNLGWQDGAYADDTWLDVAAVAIDSRSNPKYVSAAFNGGAGGLKIVNAADGTLVTTINQGVGAYYIGTGWDNVGNVYIGDANTATSWAAFSPPGANQATTPAVATIQVTASVTPPVITGIHVSGGIATIQFTGGAADPASAFTLLSSGTPGPLSSYSPAAGANITGSAGSYQATVAVSGAAQFYRIKR